MKAIFGHGLAAIALFFLGACAPAAQPPGHAHHHHDRDSAATANAGSVTITIDQVKQRLERSQPIVFIDTRNELAWETSDTLIPGSIRISNNQQLAALVKELPKESFIVPYCT